MSVDRFARLVSSHEFSLAEAFLAFAQTEYHDLDPDDYLVALDELADIFRAKSTDAADAARLAALGAFLGERGFRGNVHDYYEPENSFLNAVLDRRTGIPISLSVVWIEIGLRAGLPLAGIGMPMHFLVGLPDAGVYADPFRGGGLLSADDAVLLFGRLTDGEVPWDDRYLAPVPGRDVVRRALSNLKAVYGTRGELRKALWVEDHLLAIPGAPETERVERATVLEALRLFPEAIADIRAYIATHPEHSDELAPRIRRMQAAMN